jgi:hypothetical protein
MKEWEFMPSAPTAARRTCGDATKRLIFLGYLAPGRVGGVHVVWPFIATVMVVLA